MSKKKKLKLEDLKVQSFQTSLSKDMQKKVKGEGTAYPHGCTGVGLCTGSGCAGGDRSRCCD